MLFKPLSLGNLNSVKKLLLFLEDHGPGQWVIITNELGKIFPAPEFRFKYSEYAEQVKTFLTGVEEAGLLHIRFRNPDLYSSGFGDLNNVFCDLEKHEIQARLTIEGLKYIGILDRTPLPGFYVGPNAQVSYQSPGSNFVHNDLRKSNSVEPTTAVSHQQQPAHRQSLAEKMKSLAKTIISAKHVLVALISFLTSLGIFFSLWKTDKLPRLSFSHHEEPDSNQKLKLDPATATVWPPNLNYIRLDTLSRLSTADTICIVYIKGHGEDSIIAEKLYWDIAKAGYKPQQVQELAFIDKMDFKHRQCKLESHLLYDNSKRLLIMINPEFDFFKR